jgi:hypothetical protein
MSEMTDEKNFVNEAKETFREFLLELLKKVHEKFVFEWNFIIIFPRSIISFYFNGGKISY